MFRVLCETWDSTANTSEALARVAKPAAVLPCAPLCPLC
jgi:hypothetical protein